MTAAAGVLAHGIGGRQNLPLPFELLVQGSVLALLVSFLGLGLLWRTPRLRAGAAGRALPWPVQRAADSRGVRWALRALGLAVTGFVAVAAVFGVDGVHNPAPYAVYVLFWVGIVPLSLLFGPVWRLLNPLRTMHALLAVIVRVPADRGVAPLPRRLGYWPAAVSLLSFVWLELAAPGGSSATALLGYFTGYAAVHLTAALIFGHRWFGSGDGFEVYSTMVGTLSPFGRRDDGRLVVRNPLDGAATFGPAPGIVALVAVLLGSTFFDSLSGAPAWARLVQALDVPAALTATLGLLAVIAVVAVSFVVATVLAGRIGRQGRQPVPGLLAHSVVPIVVGYVLAHYFGLLVFEGQRAVILLSDPLDTGANLLGATGAAVDYTLVTTATIALVQVIAVVAGHVVAVVSAHDRAVALFPLTQAVVGQLPLMALMALYTIGGLTLLFAT